MRSPVPDYLLEVAEAVREDDGGAVADYIPQLAEASPDTLAIAVTTVNGRTHAAGDVDVEFSIQSISKPFAYAAAIMDRGLERVLRTVGLEPSGEAFNELSLETGTHRPKNPMINAGAIATHQLLLGEDADEDARVERALDFFSRLAGRPLAVDRAVYESEMATADRNFAIAHMLRTHGVIAGAAHDVVDGYTRQCSITVTAADLSVMAATLACGGVQPVTGERVVDAATARHTLAVMAGSGMYDAAGSWLTTVGIPAKSGVSGGLIGALPGQVGIGAMSPRLDEHGNSVRGVKMFERLSRDMGMHLMQPSTGRSDPVRDVRREADRIVYELQGSVDFTDAEAIVERLAGDGGAERVVFDTARVDHFTDVGRRVVLEGLRRLRLDGRPVSLVDPAGRLPDPDLGDGTYPDADVP
jgi:glutaminase